jgi:hypothetical protein
MRKYRTSHSSAIGEMNPAEEPNEKIVDDAERHESEENFHHSLLRLIFI